MRRRGRLASSRHALMVMLLGGPQLGIASALHSETGFIYKAFLGKSCRAWTQGTRTAASISWGYGSFI